MAVKENLDTLTTFDLAFNIATGQYTEKEKMDALAVIRARETGGTGMYVAPTSIPKAKTKLPLKGSKTERIYNLLNEGKDATEAYQILKKKKEVISPSEIYRVGKLYWPERFLKQS